MWGALREKGYGWAQAERRSSEASPDSDKKKDLKVWSLCGRRYGKRALTGKPLWTLKSIRPKEERRIQDLDRTGKWRIRSWTSCLERRRAGRSYPLASVCRGSLMLCWPLQGCIIINATKQMSRSELCSWHSQAAFLADFLRNSKIAVGKSYKEDDRVAEFC